jgi:hypothetical protein
MTSKSNPELVIINPEDDWVVTDLGLVEEPPGV